MSLNHDLSELFRTMAAVMEIKGEPVFKSIAFSKVSRLLKDMTVDIRDAFDKGTLDQIPGIGKSSQKIIADYITTGTSGDAEDLKSSIPTGLVPMLDIPSLGPKTIALLWKERGITSTAELSKAIGDGLLAGIKGLGEKKIESIREGIELLAIAGQRVGLAIALPIAEEMVERLRKIDGVARAEFAGSLRRRKETIGDVDILVATNAGVATSVASEVSKTFTTFPEIQKVLAHGETKSSILTKDGLQVDLRIVPIDSFGAALQYFTGSKEHNVKLRGLAQDKGMTLNEWGLFKVAGKSKEPAKGDRVASETEAYVYEAIGLEFVEPELREDRGEIELAQKNELPKLVSVADIRGDLHCHTTASDGVNSIEEMIEAAIQRKYDFLAITDHSKSQTIANGLTADRLLAHVAAIHKAAKKYEKQITVLAGSEVDILSDGHLDYENAVLAELDWVVASPHVALKQEPDKATDRLLRAIENPFVNLIGHPTGRLIGSRNGLAPDFTKLYKAAKETGTALEINSGWPRLDLDDVHSRGALDQGCVLSINTDAHAADGFGEIHLGVSVARRAGATKQSILNCWTTKKLLEFIGKKRKTASEK